MRHVRSGCIVSIALVAAACGGRVEGGGGDGGGDDAANVQQDSSTGDGSIDFSVCPPYPPRAGDPCSSPRQGCAYYGGKTICRVVCESGAWQYTAGSPDDC
jgi:hypothetical protein